MSEYREDKDYNCNSSTNHNSKKVKLERVIGLTVTSNACLDCDPSSGIVAYPAGCVVVLYNPRKNKQTHILNASKKTITTLSISPDGRYVATGECGHQPHVRVWDIQERIQVAEFPGHKFGINCVAFSPNLKYVVSVGSQHDMIVNVWDWRNNSKVASNKVSSKVKAVAFSEDGGHFVTVGNRHVKFWYLEYFRSSKYKEPVPLMGRSAILGEQRNNYFCDVACGQGDMADSTFAITKSGLLCEFNNRRLLDKWVELRTTSANCITVGIDFIFIGCANGIVRCFSPYTLDFITTLPRTHYLGIDVSKGLTISHMGSHPPSAKYPDTVAITLDENNHKVTCIYNDHSLYIWDIRDIRKVGKSHSFLFHSACIWGIEMYPVLDERISPVLPPGSFITCSSDDTIRIWNIDPNINQDTAYKRNIYSSDLLKVLYVDESLSYLCDTDHNSGSGSEKVDSTYDGRNGVRCIRMNPDGRHLASGDRSGNIRIHDVQYMDEVCKIEAHDAEVLCLEYSKPDTDHRYLASASRDRLIHVFDVDQDYAFQQTLDDHSSSITAVRFVQVNGQLQMISCGADKSVIFRSAQFTPQLHFSRDHHVVGKTTLYDMEVDVTQKHILTACQDRNIRVYSVNTGKHSRTFKGSVNEDGTLIKVILDNSGLFVATSSTDKNLCIYDFYSGECMATMFGHSELVTGFRFTNDGKHLISVSGDGCIFIWKLPAELTHAMQIRLSQMSHNSKIKAEARRGTFAVPRPLKPPGEIDNEYIPGNPEMFDPNANEMDGTGLYRFSVGPLPLWAKKQIAEDGSQVGMLGKLPNLPQPKGRWAQRIDSQGIVLKSIYDSGHIIPFPVQPESRRFTAEPENFDSEMHRFTDIRKEITVSKQETDEQVEFESCPESLNQIQMSNSLSPDLSVPLSGVNAKRGANSLGMRVRHPTDSSMSSVPIDDGDFDGDVADDETDSTEAEGQEIIYYPPSEDGFQIADEEFKVCNTNPDDLREAHRKNRKNKAERPTDIPLVHIQGVRSTDSEDEEEATTPHGTDRNVLSMFSVSTESLDRVGEREKFLKNNFESLDGEKSSDNENHDNRLSITAKYFSRSHHGARTAKLKKEQEALSPRKLELMKQMEENRKKLDKITWKASLNSSKSISDLTHIPEKDLYGRSHLINKENSSSETIRRAASMSDLSKPRRLLPFPPSHVTSAKSSVKSDSSGIGSSRPSSGNSSDFARLSRSSSLSTLAGGDDDSSRIMRPTISSSNKMRGSQEHLSRRALPKSASSANLAGSRRGASDTSSGETSPTESKSGFTTRVRSTSMDRNSSRTSYHSDPKTVGSARSSAIPRSSFGGSRSTSERDLTRIGRDSTNRLSSAAGISGNITVTKTSLVKRSTFTTRKSIMVTSDKAVVNDHSCKMLEKSPEELPVKDTRTERDVTIAPLNRKLCEVTADDLKLASDNLLQLYKRITMETDLPESDKIEMLNVLSEGVSESQQTLRPVNPTPGFYPDPAQIAAIAASRKNSDVSSSGDPMSLLQQYSDMLVTLVQQRMNTQTGSS